MINMNEEIKSPKTGVMESGRVSDTNGNRDYWNPDFIKEILARKNAQKPNQRSL